MIIGEYKPDGLIVNTKIAPFAKEIKIAKGQGSLLRGTVLGRVTEIGLCVVVDSSKADGSEKPYCILTDDVEVSETTDLVTTGYFTGIFDKASLIFGGSDTVKDHEDRLRELNIHLI